MYAAAHQHCVLYEGDGLMKSYILSVVAAAVICAAVRGVLSEKTGNGQLVKLLCGIFLAVTILHPLVTISFQGISGYFDGMTEDAQSWTNEGKSAAREQMDAIIKSEVQAYILDKAKRMGLDITATVELNENGVPCGVTLRGEASPYAKEVMSAFMEDNLGIAEENQKWK